MLFYELNEICYNKTNVNKYGNNMFLRIFVGIILCVVGFFMVKKPYAVLEFIGPINFAEWALSGGSRSFFKLMGVVIILVGFLVITNLHVAFFGSIFKFFFS